MTPNEFEFLENQLMITSRGIAFPPTPDLASGFWSRLESSPVRSPTIPRLRVAGIAAGAMAALVVAVALISPARDAAADLFHRINIFETDRSTVRLPTDISGRETTLEQAETALGAHILQPTEPAGLELERVLLQDYGGGFVVAALFYRSDEASFVLFASNAFAGKGIPLGGIVDVEQVSGLGNEAFWIEGRRIVQSRRPNGDLITGSERVTDVNALIWEQNGYVYRIEGDLEKDQAIAIAHSLR